MGAEPAPPLRDQRIRTHARSLTAHAPLMASATLTNRLMLGRRAAHFRLAALLLLLFQLNGPFIGNAEASVGIGSEGIVY